MEFPPEETPVVEEVPVKDPAVEHIPEEEPMTIPDGPGEDAPLPPPTYATDGLVLGLVLGTLAGVILGFALKQMPIWIAVGLLLGGGIGLFLDRKKDKK